MKAPSMVISIVVIMVTSTLVSALSAVKIDGGFSLKGEDLGLEGSSISPDGGIVVLHGSESAIFVVDTMAPENFSEVYWSGNETLLDSAFHPGGESALIVGEGGTILRLTVDSMFVEDAGGEAFFGETELRAVSWNGDGSWAYVGGEGGWLWRVRGLGDGGLEVFELEDRGFTDVNSISCLRGHNVCIISSGLGGIGVIDQNHVINWIGGHGYPWLDVVCHDGTPLECVAVSSDLTIAVISIDQEDPAESRIFDNDIVQLQGVAGTMTGIEKLDSGRSLISVAPFALIEHDSLMRMSFPWLDNHDVAGTDVELSGERIVFTWSSGDYGGWIVTSQGSLISYSALSEEGSIEIIEVWIGIIVIGGASLFVISMIASSSTNLSRWVSIKIGSEEERKRAERELRRKNRKKGRA